MININIKKALERVKIILSKNKHIKNPATEAGFLVSEILKKDRAYLYANGDMDIGAEIFENIINMAEKRALDYPLAYLTGHKEFFGLDFLVNENVLIPRPETEMLVNMTLKELKKINCKACVIDAGTGSGCVIASAAKNTRNKNIRFIASDISPEALKIARKNAKLHNLSNKIEFYTTNILKGLEDIINNDEKIIILANLPYLTPLQIDSSPTIKYEPKLALEAGHDGLSAYKELFTQIKKFFYRKRIISVFCEFDSSQSKSINKLAEITLPNFKRDIIKDLGGFDRVLKLYK